MSDFEHKLVYAQAPVRFDFAGGPTDVEPFRSSEGGYVVNAAIKQFAKVRIQPRNDFHVILRSSNFNLEEHYNSTKDIVVGGALRLIKAAVKHTNPPIGFELDSMVDVPPGSGLGSSAALSIALIAGLNTITKLKRADAERLANDALHIENAMLGNINGGQDQYASALGGFHAFSFLDNNNVVLKPLEISRHTVSEIESRSILFYSGKSRLSGKILDQVMHEYISGKIQTTNSLRKMRSLAHKMEEVLEEGNVDEFGKVIEEVGIVQKNLHPAIYPEYINKVLVDAYRCGAVGSKIAGAGGGGCVYLFCESDKKNKVLEFLNRQKIMTIPIEFSLNKGVVVRFSNIDQFRR